MRRKLGRLLNLYIIVLFGCLVVKVTNASPTKNAVAFGVLRRHSHVVCQTRLWKEASYIVSIVGNYRKIFFFVRSNSNKLCGFLSSLIR